jgi:hypothetical protein
LSCRTQRLELPDGVATWTVLNADHQVISAAEEFLEYLRVQGTSPNTDRGQAVPVRRVDDRDPAAGGDLLLPVPRVARSP